MMHRPTVVSVLFLAGAFLLFVGYGPHHRSNGPLNPADYHYYFVLNQDIRDVRDFSVVDNRIMAQKESIAFYAKDGQSLMVGSHQTRSYARYNLTGELQHRFMLTEDRTAVIAPWWTHKVYIKDQDIWAADFDWQTGQETKHRQLTQLGTFNPMYGIGFSHWYEDIMVVLIGGVQQKCYLLNTKTGEIQAMIPDETYCQTDFSDYHSPDGRYIFFKDQVIDLKTRTTRQQRRLSPYGYWQSDSTIMFVNHNQRSAVLDITSGTVQPAFEFNLHTLALEIASIQDRWSPCRWFSPSGRYFLFQERNNQADSYLWVGDTENGNRIETGLKLAKSTSMTREPLNFQWITNGNFIYVNQGDPLTQGTWFYDIHKRTSKKITPFLAQDIVVMREAGMIVFTANNHLYKVNADGTNLVQLTTEPLGRWHQYLARFLTE